MDRLPDSLSIAIFLTGSLWLVGFIASLAGAPGELVITTLAAGLIAGAFELWQTNRKPRR